MLVKKLLKNGTQRIVGTIMKTSKELDFCIDNEIQVTISKFESNIFKFFVEYFKFFVKYL